jgi:predicted NUDIX family NTP pyrophosphohydrolase
VSPAGRRRSAGVLLFRRPGSGELEVLLVHPGGPLWARRDAGAWSIPKGEYDDGEDPLAAARREFEEELGSPPPRGEEPVDLGEVRQKSGKVVRAWALAGDLDPSLISSNAFEMEWPPRSGRRQEFPEVDRAQWFGLDEARAKLNPAQAELIDRLAQALARAHAP